MKVKPSLSWLFVSFALCLAEGVIGAGCGAVVAPLNLTANTVPTARAGDDIFREEDDDEEVTLSGLASDDRDGDSLSYFWRQTLGPQVDDLEPSANSPVIEFDLPDNDDDEMVLRFTLTVIDGNGAADTDTVFIFVGDVPVPLADDDSGG